MSASLDFQTAFELYLEESGQGKLTLVAPSGQRFLCWRVVEFRAVVEAKFVDGRVVEFDSSECHISYDDDVEVEEKGEIRVYTTE